MADPEDFIDFQDEGPAFLLGELAPGVFEFLLRGVRAGAGVAKLVESENGAAEAGEGIGGPNVFVGIGIAVRAGSGEVTEEFAKADGGELEAAFGELDGVGPGEEVGEGFVPGAHFRPPELVFEPVLVTAVFPIGEVVFGDSAEEGRSARGLEFLDDTMVRDAVLNHEIELFADLDGEAGDFAGAAAAGDDGVIARLNITRKVPGVGWRVGAKIGRDLWVLGDGIHIFGAREC